MGAGFSSQRTENGKVVEVEPESHAFYRAKLILNKVIEKSGAKNYKLFIGDDKSKHFRYSIAKTLPYKGNRDSSKRPILEPAIRDYLRTKQNAIVVKGIEVDDALGISQTKDTIICSTDKDLDQIPGMHFDPDWGRERNFNGCKAILKNYKPSAIYEITDPGFVELAKRDSGKPVLIGGGQLWFCAQMLMGDIVDNIPGLPYNLKSCYKDVRAYKALKDCTTYKEALQKVWKLYQEKLTKYAVDTNINSRFEEIAQLVYIRRAKKETIYPRSWLR